MVLSFKIVYPFTASVALNDFLVNDIVKEKIKRSHMGAPPPLPSAPSLDMMVVC